MRTFHAAFSVHRESVSIVASDAGDKDCDAGTRRWSARTQPGVPDVPCESCYFPWLFFAVLATESAIATACFRGRPALSPVLMFSPTVFLPYPFFSGMGDVLIDTAHQMRGMQRRIGRPCPYLRRRFRDSGILQSVSGCLAWRWSHEEERILGVPQGPVCEIQK
jgi:hypothetical protein